MGASQEALKNQLEAPRVVIETVVAQGNGEGTGSTASNFEVVELVTDAAAAGVLLALNRRGNR